MKARFKGVCRLCRGRIIPGQNICKRDIHLPAVHTICENRIVMDEIRNSHMKIVWEESCKCVTCGKGSVSEPMQTCDACYQEV